MKIDVRNITIKVDAQYRRAGSIMAGTATAGADRISVEASFEANAPEAELQKLLRMAEASCYTAGSLREPVQLDLAATINGERFTLDEG